MALPRPRTLLGVINISPESMVSDSVVTGEEQLLELTNLLISPTYYA